MAKLSIKAGATSVSINIWIASSSSTTGGGLTGLAYNTASLTAYYTFAGAGTTSTSIALATLASVTAAWATGGFIQIDSTNMPGWYRFDIPNAVIASGNGRSVAIHFQGATNMAPLPIEIELTGWDNQDAVHGGLSAIPNVASGTTGCLVVSGSGTGGLTLAGGVGSANVTQALGNAVTTTTNGILDINVKNYNNVTATTDANNYPKVDIVDIAGTAVSVTTAQLGINVVNWNNTVVATPATAGIPDINVKNIVNTAAAVDANNYLKIDVVDIAGTAVSATSGLLNSNVTQFGGTAITQTAGIPSVNTSQFNGTAATATAGIPSVNTTQFGGTAITQTAGIPSVNTSQFLGHAVVLDVNNFPKVDVQDILGSVSVGAAGYVGVDWSQIANSTATEYLTGTTVASVLNAVPSNITQILGTAVTATSGVMGVNTIQFNGQSVVLDANNFPKVDVQDILGTVSQGAAGYVGIDWNKIDNPTTAVNLSNTTVNSITSAVSSNVTQILGTAVTATSGIMAVNTSQFGGTAITQTAGIPSVNTTQFNGTNSVGTAGYVGLDWAHIAAPTTVVGLTNTTISTGQTISAVTGAVGSVTGAVGSVTGNVGGSVNSVVTTVTANTTQFGGTAITQTAGIPSVNTSQFNGQSVVLDANNFPKVDVQDILGTVSQGAAGYVGVDWSKITNSTATENLSGTTVSNVTSAVSSNVTQFGGTAITQTAGIPSVNTTQFLGHAVVLDTNNFPKIDLEDWNGQSAAAMVASQQFTAYALANGPGGSSAGSGMYAVTFTVQDSTSMALLAGVTVSAILANTEVAYATTNSSGVAVLNLNAGTYEFLARSNSGAYFTYASTGNVVTGIEAVSIPLVAYPPIIPATPPQCVISFYLLTSAGLPRNKVRVSFSATAPSASPVGNSYTSTDFVFSTNTGLVSYTGLCGTGYTIEVQGGSSVNITTPTNVGAYVVPNPPG